MNMRNFKISSLLTILIFFLLLQGNCQKFAFKFSDENKSLTIQNDRVLIQSEWLSPIMQKAHSTNEWVFCGRNDLKYNLSGLSGQLKTDLFSNNKSAIERQVWISADNNIVAMRQKITNLGKEPIRLQTMIPLACNNSNGFQLKKNPDAKNWLINVQKRLKNEFPVTLQPDVKTSIVADPFLAIPVEQDPNGPCLLIGYLDWYKHLATIEMNFSKENGKIVFNQLVANCDFNNVVLPVNGERTTQWIFITIGDSYTEVVDDYTERVANYNEIKKPPLNAPSVYCSWYWYGLNYTEEYLLRDLNALKNLVNRKPFDVFLIDESWGIHLWGDFTPNEKFPSGMRFAANKIKELGYIPGIWTPPFLVSPTSSLAKTHPEWLLKTSVGENHTFTMNNEEHWVIDPTYPGVLEYLEESYRKLSEDWGFRYFKFDFMRAIFLDGDYHFFNPYVTRLEAYRMGLEAIRRGVGKEAYISVCGGHYGGSLGIANSQRSGSDVVAFWDDKEVPKYRQNMLRTWMSRLWHVDPDAMMVRRNEKPEFTGNHAKLSLGLFTDDEARVNAVNQYIGGGLVTFTENYETLDPDRLELYKHIIPSIHSSSFPIDWYNPTLPSMALTNVIPLCNNLEKWNTIAIINWTDEKKTFSFTLDGHVLKSLNDTKFLVFEFFSQEVKGLFDKGEIIKVGELRAHSAALYKIIPWDGGKPVLAGTDLHFSMGGIEIAEWHYNEQTIEGIINTDWAYPINITAVFPKGKNEFEMKQVKLEPNQKRFWIELTENN